jgi:uncharacterized protein
MKCPVCTETDLQLAERSGVEIDYCPKCRGVWLDRGELDKIIDRAAEFPRGSKDPAPARDERWGDDREHRDRHHDDDDRDRRYQGDDHGRRKRGGFLGNLFDFGGD